MNPVTKGIIIVPQLVILLASCGRINSELEAGYAYGRKFDLGACYQESLRRLNACSDWNCQAFASGFSRGCAATARVNVEFCEQVPDSLLQAAAWIESQCKNHANPKACYKVIQQPASKCP